MGKVVLYLWFAGSIGFALSIIIYSVSLLF